MGYFLVALGRGPAVDEKPRHEAAHVAFVESLIERHVVFLGGDFSDPIHGIDAAYLLSCETFEDAKAIAARDPYVLNRVYEAETVEQELVGIDPELIDPDLVEQQALDAAAEVIENLRAPVVVPRWAWRMRAPL